MTRTAAHDERAGVTTAAAEWVGGIRTCELDTRPGSSMVHDHRAEVVILAGRPARATA